MTSAIKDRIPTSIEYDPVIAAKYKTKRDYYYHEDPVYRKHVHEQNKEYIQKKKLEDPNWYQQYNKRGGLSGYTRTPEQLEKLKEQRKEVYSKNRDIVLQKQKLRRELGLTPSYIIGKKPRLSEGLELRENDI